MDAQSPKTVAEHYTILNCMLCKHIELIPIITFRSAGRTVSRCGRNGNGKCPRIHETRIIII